MSPTSSSVMVAMSSVAAPIDVGRTTSSAAVKSAADTVGSALSFCREAARREAMRGR